ncbi:MAG: hypothetical protein HYT80_07455 [Euryarchaeota archaeon]|nr:hypothetical protein [Euryarchaeota archaeon]
MRLTLLAGTVTLGLVAGVIGIAVFDKHVDPAEHGAWRAQLVATSVAAALALAVGAGLLCLGELLERDRIKRILVADIDETIDSFENWGKPEEGRGITIHLGEEAVLIQTSLPRPIGLMEAAKSPFFGTTTIFMILQAVGKLDVYRERVLLLFHSLTLGANAIEDSETFRANLHGFFLDPLIKERNDLVTLLQDIRLRVNGSKFVQAHVP